MFCGSLPPIVIRTLRAPGRDLALPFPPGFELASQQRISGPKQKAGIRFFAMLVEVFAGVGILIEYQIGYVCSSVTCVIDQQQLQSDRFQDALVFDIELISVHHNPTGLSAEVAICAERGRILLSSGRRSQNRDVKLFRAEKFFERRSHLGRQNAAPGLKILQSLVLQRLVL